MKLIAQVKLNPTPEQHAALLSTLTEANAACDTISAAAWQAREFRRLPLQKLVYHDIKTSFRLGAQILVRCIDLDPLWSPVHSLQCGQASADVAGVSQG